MSGRANDKENTILFLLVDPRDADNNPFGSYGICPRCSESFLKGIYGKDLFEENKDFERLFPFDDTL